MVYVKYWKTIFARYQIRITYNHGQKMNSGGGYVLFLNLKDYKLIKSLIFGSHVAKCAL